LSVLFVDSNVFFYAKIMDREYGRPCAEALRKIESGEVAAATSVLVIVELANALRRYGLSEEVKDVVDALFSLEVSVLQVDSTDVRNAINIFNDARISPYDCVHVAVMRRVGIGEIVSADREFDKVPNIKRVDPHDL